MNLADAFPPLGLRVEAGPLVLRPITDEVLSSLIDLALDGVHPPEEMPFFHPWTDAPSDRLPANFAQFHWGVRSGWSPERWSLEFAVEYEGRVVGSQGFFTTDYPITRSGETGSWLGMEFQGRGIGTRMRQAICALAFDHLDAVRITSGAFLDNPASLAVSRKVGYQPNGVRLMPRRGQAAENQSLLLTPDRFVRGEPITVTGLPAFRSFIGLD